MFRFEARVSVRGMSRFRQNLRAGGPHVERMLKRWGVITRSYLRGRFVTMSKGGWPPHSPNYQRTRGSMDSAAVLRDTGILLAALTPDLVQKGALEDRRARSLEVRVGYGGDAPHPGADMAIAELARIHDQGLGNVPARPIIVRPDDQSIRMMTREAAEAVKAMKRDSGL